MNLGKLIERLEIVAVNNPDAQVEFEFCGAFPLLEFGSSRCHYERLAVDWWVHRRHDAEQKHTNPTAKAFAAALKSQMGTRITGYKGGDYTVTPWHPLHIDGYGECTSTVVSGVRDEGYRVVLETENE